VWGNRRRWLIGLGVDAISGGMYELTPDQLSALTQRQSEGAALKLEIEKDFDPVGLRARLLARRNSEQADK
jgi:hypothetical protein